MSILRSNGDGEYLEVCATAYLLSRSLCTVLCIRNQLDDQSYSQRTCDYIVEDSHERLEI